MAISSSVRHGVPIADIRQSPLPGAELQAFPTRQFQEFLDDLELATDQVDSDKIEQELSLFGSLIGKNRAIINTANKRIKSLFQMQSVNGSYLGKILARLNRSEERASKMEQAISGD